MRVREAMTANVTSCTLESTLAGIASRMWLGSCGAVPVLDEGGRIAGIITDRDICFAVATTERPASEIKAKELVARSRVLYTCGAEDDVRDAVRLMREKRVRRLPVVDTDGRLVGILSMTDAILRADRRGLHDLGYEEVMGALRSLCRTPERVPLESELHA
jgi:CBS domain-containing protein